MMGCFSTAQTDGTEDSLQSLKSLLATKQAPLPTPWMVKKLIERKLGLDARKTLRARTKLLDTACHSLAKAKQRTLISLPSSSHYMIKTDHTTLFPLPLPPGYKPVNTKKNTNSSSQKSTTISKISVNISDNSSFTSHSSNSPCHSLSNSDSVSSCPSSEFLTPSSSTLSSVFSSAPSSSSSSSSSSLKSKSTSKYNASCCNSSLYRNMEDGHNSSSFPLPIPSSKVNVGSPLLEFSPLELERACGNFDEAYKLRDGVMGTFYKAFLSVSTDAKENIPVAIAKVTTKHSKKRWKAQVQNLAALVHPNLSKVIGFSYEQMNTVMPENNRGFIVYENRGNEGLDEFLEDVEKGIDWPTRLKIAIGTAEALAFLLDKMPNQVNFGNLTVDSIRVDSNLNAKLLYFVLLSNLEQQKGTNSCDVVHNFGSVLLQLFNFTSYPQDGEFQFSKIRFQSKVFPSNDAKVVIDLAARCLLPECSLRPSMQHVARVLHSIEPTQCVPKFAIKRSKSFIYRKRRSLSFG